MLVPHLASLNLNHEEKKQATGKKLLVRSVCSDIVFHLLELIIQILLIHKIFKIRVQFPLFTL